MEKQEVQEVIACLPEDRTLFHYYRDRYAFLLLAHARNQYPRLSQVRKSRYARLLQKPVVKEHLAQAGNVRALDECIERYWPKAGVTEYVLTLGMWGDPKHRSYSQTSRRGFNLVLHLNLNSGDMQRFEALVEHPRDYNYRGHPVCPKQGASYRETLAWARLDVSFDTNEVLIEEIQSDFVRYVEWNRKQHRDHDAVIAFAQPFRAVWQEAMLTATLQFVWDELGINQVYFHEHETGNALKGIRYRKPPRSLYEELPRKFCMERRALAPTFLTNDRFTRRVLKTIKRPSFYVLNQDTTDGAA